ncbi:3-keto-5-aminohexanoate cleavage protein [Luteipulveratus sp. YIM 133132]|uniref:3-keto-5-aminohexanoate cleavage protein n=1 Tax=Luteipulveratus flavus TaxID=3031728 RepID=UPI0023AF0A8D|nr:3-keto-5-aminohexanoate cleavage protein [Luteipulveratus sp. YIM 133132]MDE9364780.1 3-keto-5-aminohexanoate cleavage protein [Luteipulveratus sp. YIM 133132]
MLIKVCPNGPRPLEDHPRLSADPALIAQEAAAAVRAGAGAVHVHPKDESGADSLRADDVERFVAAIRAACPGVPVGATTGAWAMPDAAERVAAIDAWTTLPDFASLNWHEEGADDVAAALLGRGVGVEAGIWHRDGLAAWRRSPYRGRCLRALIELPDVADANEVDAMARDLVAAVGLSEPALPVLLHGEGRSTWPAVERAVAWRLDTRIGLEDCLVGPDGEPAQGNAQLVRDAVRLARRPGG